MEGREIELDRSRGKVRVFDAADLGFEVQFAAAGDLDRVTHLALNRSVESEFIVEVLGCGPERRKRSIDAGRVVVEEALDNWPLARNSRRRLVASVATVRRICCRNAVFR